MREDWELLVKMAVITLGPIVAVGLFIGAVVGIIKLLELL